MLDVVFIMLIFFIVVASFVKESAINLNIPEAGPNPEQAIEATLISVNAADEIFIDSRRVEPSSVRAVIAQKIAENPKLAIAVRMDERAHAATYVGIADAARQEQVRDLTLTPVAEYK